ncbi:hypothetical protein DFH09DRAFT_1327626 [Mycena vulgaris]|nr:hypothetical protein DFH09DRAFT_1327626 [Mycena vulgaris]
MDVARVYKADGDGHSWDWLALISPCVDILRGLATRIHKDLGARQGSKHTIPKLDKDVAVLMDSLDEHSVYTLQEGRVLDDDEKPVPDILSAGMAALTHGSSISPLAEFNQQPRRLARLPTANADAPGNPGVASAPTGDGTGNVPAEDPDDTDSDEELSQDEELDVIDSDSPKE